MRRSTNHLVLISSMLAMAALDAHAIPSIGHKMMVAGPSPCSAGIVREIADKGGNVIDATVAVAFGLAVTSPYYAALGGGGFAMVKVGDGPVRALDFRETAPRDADAKMYVGGAKNASIDGGLAVAVPGMAAGLWDLHRAHGKLPWKTLLAPSIRLAKSGFRVSGEWTRITERNKERFNPGGVKAFFKKDGSAYRPGETFKQPSLARALERIASRGAKGFYEGPIAADIVSAIKKSGGTVSLEDLKSYRTRWLEPLKTTFEGHSLHLMPPPSSGGVVITTALKVLDAVGLKTKRPLSIDELHGLAEALKIGFRGRIRLGDPDFSKNPIAELTSTETIAKLAKRIKADKALKLEPLREESGQTTHVSVMDASGDAVALTVTLNGDYGSGVVSPEYGVALNNEMDDFTTRPGEPNMFGLIQGRENEIAPGKRPLSSMSPTLVEKNGQIVMTLGSPGGPRIISAVLQVLYRTLVSGFDMDQAIQAPRVHHQFLPDVLHVDARRLPPETLDALRARGHKVEESVVAKVYGVRRIGKSLLEAAFDSRGEGGAGGY